MGSPGNEIKEEFKLTRSSSDLQMRDRDREGGRNIQSHSQRLQHVSTQLVFLYRDENFPNKKKKASYRVHLV